MTPAEQKTLPWVVDGDDDGLARLRAVLPMIEAKVRGEPDVQTAPNGVEGILRIYRDDDCHTTLIVVYGPGTVPTTAMMLDTVRSILTSDDDIAGPEAIDAVDEDELRLALVAMTEAAAGVDDDQAFGFIVAATPLGTGGLWIVAGDLPPDPSPRWCLPGRITIDWIAENTADPAQIEGDETIVIEASKRHRSFVMPDAMERLRMEKRIAASRDPDGRSE